MSELVRQEPGQMSARQLEYIANTEFIPRQLRGNLPAIMACVATGRALGIADMTALRQIHVIDGRPAMSAELMVQLVRRAGHSISGETSDGQATAAGKRSDTDDAMTVTWSIGMAERANLLGKDNWKKYPEAMLWARAVSQLCRMLFPDVLGGVSLTPDEAEWSPEERVSEQIGSAIPADTEQPDDAPPAAVPSLELPPVEQTSFADRIPSTARRPQ